MENPVVFERWSSEIKNKFKYVAVCTANYEKYNVFPIPFDNEKQLRDFLYKNTGTKEEIGFYCQGFVDGKYIGENRGISPNFES